MVGHCFFFCVNLNLPPNPRARAVARPSRKSRSSHLAGKLTAIRMGYTAYGAPGSPSGWRCACHGRFNQRLTTSPAALGRAQHASVLRLRPVERGGQKARFRCVSRYIRPWCAVVFTRGMRERHRTSPAGFESSRGFVWPAGGRRWRASLAGVAGEAHKKTDQFH